MRGRRRRDRSAVHPDVIDTPIWTKVLGSTGRNVPIGLNEVAKAGVPLGRVGQAQEIESGGLCCVLLFPLEIRAEHELVLLLGGVCRELPRQPPGSSLTHRWGKTDSNHRSLS